MIDYKISPSILEQFRLLYIGAYNKDVNSFKEYILGQFVANEASSRGTAYHEMLENGPDKYIFEVQKGKVKTREYHVFEKELGVTWKFSSYAVQPIFDIRSQFDLIFETWMDYTVTIEGKKILMRMRFDGMDGLTLHEFKTTKNAPKAYSSDELGYLDSIQHKCYMAAAPELRSVYYHIFQLNAKNTNCKYERYYKTRNGDEEKEVYNWLRLLIAWIENYPELMAKLAYNK